MQKYLHICTHNSAFYAKGILVMTRVASLGPVMDFAGGRD
jgi:hypothetical protein